MPRRFQTPVPDHLREPHEVNVPGLWNVYILGIGIASYVGFNFIIGEAHDHLISYMSGSSIPIQQILGLAKLDVVLNIYFAAITTKMFIAGMNKAGEVKRFKFLTGDGLG